MLKTPVSLPVCNRIDIIMSFQIVLPSHIHISLNFANRTYFRGSLLTVNDVNNKILKY